MFLFSSLLFVYCRPTMLLLHGGAFIMLHFPFCVSYIRKMIQKVHFLYQKFAHIKKKQYLCSVNKKNKTTTKNKNDMKTTFIGGTIARETEKAICLTTLVQWGAGKVMQKGVWFPKSTVIATTENGIEVEHEMAYSISCRNMYNGYVMEFVNSEENNE